MVRISLGVAFILIGAQASPSMQTVARGVSLQSPQGTQRPGQPPRDNQTPQSGTGRIRGRVVAVDTGAALRRAQVTLTSGQLGVRRFATTDANGRYEFAEVAEGRYNLSATKGGYVTLQFGQRRAFEPGRPVAIAEGQDLAQVDIALPRGSVIAGRISDEFGEPIAGAQVQVQRYQYGPSGQRRLAFAGGTGLILTNDLGEFRAYGLMPGEYIVSGIVRQPTFQQGANPNDTSEGYAPTYYPGSANPAEAELVTVGLAQEVAVHLTLQATRMARVSGTIVDSDGRPLVGGRVMLRTVSGEGGAMMSAGVVAGDGVFSLANVPPGDHYIDVAVPPRTPGAVSEAASVPITVANENVTNLRISTGPAALVAGKVVFEGTSPRAGVSGGLRVVTQSPDAVMGPMLGFEERGMVEENGTFQVRGMGRVFFRPINLGPWTLKRVVLDGADITDTPYELRPSERIEGLHVVLTDRVTDVSGGVRDARGQALTEFVVVVQPAREVDAARLQRFLRTARPDQKGRYSLRGLPPGDYVATAVEVLEQGEEWNPEYRPRLREAGRRFSVREGEAITMDLAIAPSTY